MAQKTAATVQLGVTTADITPAKSVPLAGFASRSGLSDGVCSRLNLQVFAFDAAVLVCADLLWWGPDLADRVRTELAARHGLDRSAVLLHASHTHSAPMPGLTFSPAIGAGDPDYLRQLEPVVHAAVERAMGDRRPVQVEVGSATACIGMSRRRKNSDSSVAGADPTGVMDPAVTVVRFSDPRTSEAVGLWVHYACHPVITDDLQVSADYPGAVRRKLIADSADLVVGFLQGCCGDIDPALLTDDGEFRRGDVTDVDGLGGELAAAARTALAGAMQLLDGQPSTPWQVASGDRERIVALPLVTPDAVELARMRRQSSIWGEWSCELATLERLPDHADCLLTLLQPLPGLALLGINAEVTVPYQHWLKRHYGTAVLPLPYTNGMIGYICTADQIADGGYEPAESYPYIYRAGPFAPQTEATLQRAIDELLQDQ